MIRIVFDSFHYLTQKKERLFSLKLILNQSRILEYQFVNMTISKSLDVMMITNKMWCWSVEQNLELVILWTSLCGKVGVCECEFWLGTRDEESYVLKLFRLRSQHHNAYKKILLVTWVVE